MTARVFIYGMQSSGATLFTLLLAQIPDSLAIPDLWAPYTAPRLRADGPVIVKATIVEVPYRRHIESFAPTTTLLFLRDPAAIAASLDTKSYRDYGGSMEWKLRKYDDVFSRRAEFDAVIHYEDLVEDPAGVVSALQKLGLPLPDDARFYRRPVDSIVDHARSNSSWCARHYRHRWGLGQAHMDRQPLLDPPANAPNLRAVELACEHSPLLFVHYQGIR